MPPETARSWLFTPATRPERFSKAREAGADVLVIDLEDSVSLADKDAARRNAIGFLTGDAGHLAALVALRMNALETSEGIADLAALLASGVAPGFLLLPKVETAGHVHILDRLCTELGLDTRLVALVESARGLSQADAIAAASPRLHGLMLGAADMAADLGAEVAWEPLLYARSRLVAACAAAGVQPIDSPFFDIRDPDGLVAECRRAAALGFTAKGAIHPGQLDAINASQTPTPGQVAEARAVLAENEKGVGVVAGRMIDEAVARRARRVLAAANRT